MVFNRFVRTTERTIKDVVGRVHIRIALTSSDPEKLGNISHNLTIAEAKVSDVADVVERALFGEDN